MKKKLLKITLSILCMLGLASCLGDSTGYFSGSGFAYITIDQNSYTPVAYVLSSAGVNPIKSSVLSASDLESGDCASVDFKVYLDQTSGGAFITDDFAITKKYYRNDQLDVQRASAPVVAATDTLSVFEKLEISAGLSNSDMGDRWLLVYRTSLQKDQKETLSIYYDPANQPKLEDGIVYVDFRVAKSDPVAGEKYTSADKNIVADMSYLRNMILQSSGKSQLSIFFRYYGNVKTNNVSSATEVISSKSGTIVKTEE